ncbi:MAG TPA: hypothetical protein VGC09_14190 [Rhodopila sp.]
MLISISKLDRASRRALRWMMVRLCTLLTIWSFPWVVGKIPLAQVLVILSLTFTMTSLMAMFVATLRRERFGAASLNTWDEAAVFCGLAVLVHAVHRVAY